MADITQYTMEQLVDFIIKAKKAAYAGDGAEVSAPERQGFKELVFSEGDFSYRDSYTGFFMAPGQEVVRFKGVPVWTMSYSGGMYGSHCRDAVFAKKTFAFLKQALLAVPREAPFRGPSYLGENGFVYTNNWRGDVSDFDGMESISFEGCPVFSQRYIGGVAVPKSTP